MERERFAVGQDDPAALEINLEQRAANVRR